MPRLFLNLKIPRNRHEKIRVNSNQETFESISHEVAMKLWSRGLGRTEVLMDFRYYKTIKDPESDSVFIIGNMQDPVNWEFRITFTPEDVPGLIKTFVNFSMIMLVIKNIPQYFIYLWNRKKLANQGSDDLEKKVNDAYDQVMFGRRPGERQRRVCS